MSIARNTLVVALVVFSLYLAAALLYREPPPAPVYNEVLGDRELDSVAIEANENALTFARVQAQDRVRRLLVQSYQGGMVSGVDLNAAFATSTTDPVALFNEHGYTTFETLGRSRSDFSAPAETLLVPIETHREHVATGINYAEHGEEVEAGDTFIFPKRGVVEGFNTPVPVQDALLDYEAELGLVTLHDISAAEPRPERFGLLLTQDFTDRRLLMERADLGDLASGNGFPEAKGREHYLKVGNLLVIPRDFWSYYATVTARLYVNGGMRQLVEPRQLIWKPDRIVAELVSRFDQRWPFFGASVGLSSQGRVLPRGTIIFTGTPAGVVFRPPILLQRALSPVDWALSGFRGTIVVAVRADKLGVMRITVIP